MADEHVYLLSPRLVIEQVFSNQYSINQKTTMLTSLAFGGRELAGLPSLLPSAETMKQQDLSFATQKLPRKLHARYMVGQISSREASSKTLAGSELQALTEDITKIALTRTRDSAQDTIPEAAREKMLTVRSTKRKPVFASSTREQTSTQPAFANLAAETFIMPIINRFWLYMRDVATSSQDFRKGVFSGGSAGSATLLEPLVLTKLVSTLAILIDAGKTSPHFLAVLAPECLEVVLSLRSVQSGDEAVLASLLQLALVVLDSSMMIDGGQMLARDFARPVWRIKDWAEESWNGRRASKQGDEVDATTRAAAGVLLRVEGIVSKTIGYH